jgi:multidrug efflux pump subunit AcrA (membrane-fusion protein)
LRINRSAPAGGSSRKFRALRKIVGWLVVITLIGGGFFLLKDYFNPGLEVQLVTVSLTSPAQANAVLTASGYVVARRKAVASGTGTLVYLGVEGAG